MALIPVFVINLDRAQDRLKSIDAQLTGLGIPYERFPAVDGANVSAEVVSTLVPNGTYKGILGPSRGEIGCFLSHRGVLQVIKARCYERACILEDDVHLSPRFACYLDEDLIIPDEIDVLKLEIVRPRQRLRIIRHESRYADSQIVFVPRGGIMGSAAYIIKGNAVDKLLRDLTLMRNAFDAQVFDHYESVVSVRHLFPLPATQEGESGMGRTIQAKKRKTPTRSIGNALRKPIVQTRLMLKEFAYHRKNFGLRVALAYLLFPRLESTMT